MSGGHEPFSIHSAPPPPAVRAPVGAMWYADWLSEYHAGPDGRALVVMCPGGHEWLIDGRASNCDHQCVNCGHPYHEHSDSGGYNPTRIGCDNGYQPRDGGAHRCWVRHGVPPAVSVDKSGLTCGAGGGSILVPGWHGFLQQGVLHP